MKTHRLLLPSALFFCLSAFSIPLLAQSSVLKTGRWYKFSVASNGVYKIDYNLLKSVGINPDQIDPKKIKLYAGLNSMLPQKNSAPRPADLVEIAISVNGEGDSKFNKEDYILFYGQGPDLLEFVPAKGLFKYENNIYSDKNFYFLTISDQNGKRLGNNTNLSGTYPIIDQFEDFAYYENDKTNILSSGREWFGEQFDISTEAKIRFDIAGIVDGSAVKVVSQVMAQSIGTTSFKLFFNNTQVAEQKIGTIPNTSYGIKGVKAIDTVTFAANTVNAPGQTSQEIKYQFVKNPTASSVGYLDFVTIHAKRKLAWSGSPIIFTSTTSLQYPTSTFEIAAFPDEGRIWEITDWSDVREQAFARINSKGMFSSVTNSLKKFVMFIDKDCSAATFESQVDNQDLHGMSAPSLLIVTHPDFKEEADRLAAHRINHNGLTVQVVTVQQVYNEFSGGKQDVTAIRDLARSLYLKNGGFKNLLLFGRCSFDYKNRTVDNSNFVPTYESRNSLSPLETYSSDDYFAFFDASEGEWTEGNNAENATMEIGVGRISVRKLTDAHNVVDKLINYDIDKKSYGDWRKKVLFVADDGDFNLHHDNANELADNIENNHLSFNTKKLFLTQYKQLRRASGQYSPEATAALNREINEGALIVNYTGHGSEHLLMEERIIDPTSINDWKNKHYLPLFVTATCDFGSHDNPLLTSTGEMIITKKDAGAIGLVGTSRPVYSETNFTLNKAFYNALFEKVNGKNKDLGAIFKDTKNKSISGVSNRNFALLGDPSMHLAIAENEMAITSIKTATGSDTLKAQSTVVIKGEIRNGQTRLTDFDGMLEATLFDKAVSITTPGDPDETSTPPSPPFTFKERSHILFNGQANVANGAFEIRCVLPKAMATEVGNGKLSLYASNNAYSDQATGGVANFKIGKAENITDSDTNGPEIALFLGDLTYRPGGAVGTDTRFVAALSDKHGINISGYTDGNLEITLDDSIHYIGNFYFASEKDDFTNGVMDFPISKLAKGNHTLKLKAWDNWGNSSERSITFQSSEESKLVIDSFNGYPNPVVDNTSIQFSHNRPGEDLEAQLIIYNSMGQLISSVQYAVSESLYNVTLTDWSAYANGIKLNQGIYFMRLSVRSLTDGAKNEKITRLIVLN